jgi:hypothetical protein
MKLSFLKALERFGASGSATLSWQHVLGRDWDACRHLLQPTGQSAHCVLHPQRPEFQLDLMPEGEEDFVAVCDDCSIPPIPVTAAEAVELAPCWHVIAHELGSALGFAPAVWDQDGCVRRIGSAHNAAGIVTPVLLFLPPGMLGDQMALFESLALRAKSLVLLPSGRWVSPGLDALRSSIGHEFVALSERFAQPADSPAIPKTLQVIADGPPARKVSPVIRPDPAMTWEDVTVTIRTGRAIGITVRGQEGSHTFRGIPRSAKHHPLAILMELAKSGQWTNPNRHEPDYEKTSKAFQRTRHLLSCLVPFPGDPFARSGGAYIPVFRIVFGKGLMRSSGRQYSRDPASA